MHEERGGVERFLRKQSNSIVRRITGQRTYYDAQKFVATDEVSGKMQSEIIFNAGATSQSNVLEVGCGCLSAGLFLIERLDADRYVGIEPNQWLVDASLGRPNARAIATPKRPIFINNLDFDPSSAGRKFDFVLSHSILSHAAHWQLPLFLRNVGACLAPDGKIFASLIPAEGNPYGSKGSPDGKDSMDEEWVYPGASYFTRQTIQQCATEAGLTATLRHDITEKQTRHRPLETHDWYMFAKCKE